MRVFFKGMDIGDKSLAFDGKGENMIIRGRISERRVLLYFHFVAASVFLSMVVGRFLWSLYNFLDKRLGLIRHLL